MHYLVCTKPLPQLQPSRYITGKTKAQHAPFLERKRAHALLSYFMALKSKLVSLT